MASAASSRVRSAGRNFGFVIVTLVLLLVVLVTGYFLFLGYLWSR